VVAKFQTTISSVSGPKISKNPLIFHKIPDISTVENPLKKKAVCAKMITGMESCFCGKFLRFLGQCVSCEFLFWNQNSSRIPLGFCYFSV
jgi:hypothetical protein